MKRRLYNIFLATNAKASLNLFTKAFTKSFQECKNYNSEMTPAAWAMLTGPQKFTLHVK